MYSKGYWWIYHDKIPKKYWRTKKESLENVRHKVSQGKAWHVISTVHFSKKIKPYVKKVIESGRGRKDGSWSSKRGKTRVSSCVGAYC